MQLRDRARDGECELRSRSEARVWRQRTMNRNPHAGLQFVMGKECARERLGTIRSHALDAERPIETGRQQQRRLGRCGADPAEPPPERTTQVEDSKMEPRRRFDENGVGSLGPDHGAASGRADRMNSAKSAIASNSRGPAVLSTIV